MANTVRVEKKLILEFSLPGYRGSSSSVSGRENAWGRDPEPRQLERENNTTEHWTLEINAANARETMIVLRELATQIDMALSEGALR